MVSKKILGVAIAAALASQGAFAVVDITGQTGAVNYAKEAITTVTSGFVDVSSTTNQLDINVEAGFGVVATNHVYVRFNLIGAKFKDQVVAGDLTGVTANTVDTVSVSQGGTAGSNYVIFDITAGSAGLDQANVLQLALDTLKLDVAASGASVYYTLFNLADASLAVAATGTTTTGSLASGHYTFATISNALSTEFGKTNNVADVASDFTTFLGNSTSEVVGSVKFNLDTTSLLVDGTAVSALSEVATDDSDVVIGGNLGFGDLDLDGCAIDADSGSLLDGGDCVLSDFSENVAYDVSISVDGETTINPGTYTAAVDYVKVGQYEPTDANGDLGTITRNGTSIQVPYLTTFTDYNQRVVLVNRSAKAAPYKFAFTTEAGVTAANGTKYSGSIPANSTLVLKAADVVTLTGGSRTAATITVTAQEANIDAATTTVNLSDKSTDTVNLIDHSQGSAM